jgi:TatD DNase family protein
VLTAVGFPFFPALAYRKQLRTAMYIDSHAHLEGKRFDSDREQVLERASAAGVDAILAIGIGDGPGTLDCAIRLAERFPQLRATVGIHPHEAQLATETGYQELGQLAKHPKVIAWGEIGLDYFYDHSPRAIQVDVFIRQMEMARAAKLPIIIHCRPSDNSENAWNDSLRLIREHWASSGVGGILHCFTGAREHAKAALDMGFLISFAGNVTFPKAEQIRDVASEIPLDRMLIETDSPFLAPIPHRGKRNEPAFVVEVARKIAELRQLSPEEVGLQTAENFRRFFSLHETVNTI